MIAEKMKSILCNLKEMGFKKNPNYKHIILFGISFLIFSYIMIYLIDILNIWNLRNIFKTFDNLDIPLFWHFWFREGSIVEIVQWSLLGIFVINSFYISGKLKEEKESEKSRFWFLLGLFSLIILIEDPGNIRFFIRNNLIQISSFSLKYYLILDIISAIILSLIPIYAILRYRKYVLNTKKLKILFLLSLIFYSTAYASARYRAPAENLYHSFERLGDQNLSDIHRKSNKRILEENPESLWTTKYRFIDQVIEESLELLGITFLLATLITFKRNHYKNK